MARLGMGSRQRNSWVTDDHPVLTPDGWRRAGDLQSGDAIVTEYRAPNALQMQVIVGTLLGDEVDFNDVVQELDMSKIVEGLDEEEE